MPPSEEKTKFLNFDFEVKAVDEATGKFEGYASTFNNIDLGGDKVMPGAFKKTIRDNKGKFPVLADHDPTKQIGWNVEAEEDAKGLFVKGELLIKDVQLARERYAIMQKALELKTPAGFSIGYRSMKWDIDTDEDGMQFRKLKEIKLYEYSFVTFPMNTMAMATAAKQFEIWMRDVDADVPQLMEKFVARLIEEGFNDQEIKSALQGAAAKIGKPEPNVAHLFDQLNQDLKKIF